MTQEISYESLNRKTRELCLALNLKVWEYAKDKITKRRWAIFEHIEDGDERIDLINIVSNRKVEAQLIIFDQPKTLEEYIFGSQLAYTSVKDKVYLSGLHYILSISPIIKMPSSQDDNNLQQDIPSDSIAEECNPIIGYRIKALFEKKFNKNEKIGLAYIFANVNTSTMTSWDASRLECKTLGFLKYLQEHHLNIIDNISRYFGDDGLIVPYIQILEIKRTNGGITLKDTESLKVYADYTELSSGCHSEFQGKVLAAKFTPQIYSRELHYKIGNLYAESIPIESKHETKLVSEPIVPPIKSSRLYCV